MLNLDFLFYYGALETTKACFVYLISLCQSNNCSLLYPYSLRTVCPQASRNAHFTQVKNVTTLSVVTLE